MHMRMGVRLLGATGLVATLGPTAPAFGHSGSLASETTGWPSNSGDSELWAPLVANRGGDSAAGSESSWSTATKQRETQLQLSQARAGEGSATEDETTSDPRLPGLQVPPELGGVLTPKGQVLIEPSIQFSNSQVNRFNFNGVEILETFLVGLVEAEDADRDLFSAAVTGRWGVTNRLELEAKVPYIYRNDTVSTRVVNLEDESGEAPAVERELDGDGIGDVEAAVHYQLNQGSGGWPFFVYNLRYKSNTGTGPFEVDRDATGVETELSTGSGFHAIEPSMTVLYPSDPAVLFANVGYLINIKEDVNKTFATTDGERTIGEVDPGDALRVSFGMGYAVNERTSLTLGYKHDFINETDTEINGIVLPSSSQDVGALLLGWGFQFNPKVAANVNLELGVTADAPDVNLTVRVPFSL
jgi:hypothetical protein